MFLRKITTKNYRLKIKHFVRQYNSNAKKLDFLVTDSKNVTPEYYAPYML